MPARVLVLCLTLLAAVLLPGCDRGYSQSTPDAVLTTARKMVTDGRPDLLPDLFYAETPQVRELLNDLGTIMGNMQLLAKEVQRRFPAEVAQLAADAEDAAKRGEATGFVARLGGLVSQGAGRRPRGSPIDAATDNRRADAVNGMLMELFADPYGWITRHEAKLGTQRVSDEQSMVTWDGQPALQPIGVTLRLDGGKWYVVLPTSLPVPGLSRIMPQTPEEYETLGYLLAAINNAVLDTKADVANGKAGSLEDVARVAGEKAVVPAALVMVAYGRLVDMRQREASKAAAAAAAAKAAAPPGR